MAVTNVGFWRFSGKGRRLKNGDVVRFSRRAAIRNMDRVE
jgi:hypothetical protein